MSTQWSRRSLLERCLAFGALTITLPASLTNVAAAWDESENRKLSPTPHCELGPFYKRLAPHETNLRKPGDIGMPLAINGRVYGVSGELLPNATVEVWQTDHFGHYDNSGYRFRAALESSAKGEYSFESVMPGHYPQRVCQHVHYMVRAEGHEPLITQLYFGTDPVFEGDPENNFHRDPLITSRELVRPVMIKGDPKAMIAAVNFDVVLEKK